MMLRGALVLSVSILLLGACQKPTTYGPAITGEELTKERDYQQQLISEARAQGGLPRQWRRKAGVRAQFERVAERIEDAGAKLCREMGLPQQGRSCYYYFELTTARDINAAATGKDIVINGGMMRFIENDDELALVMAHELAHNLMQHVDSLGQNARMGSLAGWFLDSVATTQGIDTRGGITQLGDYAGRAGFAPEFEIEADYIGAYIAARAGYNVSQAARYWRRISQQEPDSAHGGAYHPSNAERFVMMQKTIDEIQSKRRKRIPLLPEIKKDVTNSL